MLWPLATVPAKNCQATAESESTAKKSRNRIAATREFMCTR
jgi:hypothetical protein